MYYYQFHIGDYVSHTQRLSLLEDLAYRRLLDEYYLHQRPLNSGVTSVARQIGMRDQEDEVKFVLESFFTLTDDGWVNARAEKQIADYKDKIEKASRAGKASAQQRFNGRSTDVQPTNNHKPITNNHKPINTKEVLAEGYQDASHSLASGKPVGNENFETFWKAYPKKSGKDLARTAFVKRKVNNELLETMLKAIAQQKNTDQWKKDNGQFIPMPSTWLNQGRWQDEVTSTAPNYTKGLL